MFKMISLGEKFGVTDDIVDWDMPDAEGVKERFAKGFSVYVDDKKRSAIESVVAEEFPQFAQNEDFIQKVMATLGNNLEDERRFVFLVLNPQYRTGR